jgi:hypothetical protein
MRLPHLGVFQNATACLKLRALAELELGRNQEALGDVELSLRLIENLRNERTLITHFVRKWMAESVLATIWQGAADHRWTDDQLVALESGLQKFDWLSDYARVLQTERAVTPQLLDEMRVSRDPQLITIIHSQTGRSSDQNVWEKAYRFIPGGWFEQNKVSYLAISSVPAEWHLAAAGGHVDIPELRQRAAALRSRIANSGPYSFLAVHLAGGQAELPIKFIKTEALTRLARTALALERYRLARGSYPEELQSLAPQFVASVPSDVIGGGELRYRRNDGDRLVLYSVGWNGKDDGGVVALVRGKTFPDDEAGDWVWQYPRE